MKKFVWLALTMFFFLFFQRGDAWTWELFDGKLSMKGYVQQTLNVRTHEDHRDVRFSSFRTKGALEGLYTITSTADLNIQFYTLLNYYYDQGLDLDSNQRHAIRKEAGKSSYRDFRRPRNSEEWLTECYLDINYKDFQIRLGKQLVSWGETAESRVADLINPLDLKYMIAFPEWESYKIGLWMARLYYTPQNFWQDLAFELLIIPFDFEETRLPPAGSGLFFGGPAMPNYLMQKIFDAQRRDAPNDGRRNFEIGLRIRGYTKIGEGVDWYLSHFYTRMDSPLIDEAEGYNNFLRLALGFPLRGKIYTYPHYNSTALSFATTWNKIGSIIEGECTYNTNRDYQYGQSDIKEKDLVTLAFSLKRATMVPWLSEWNRNRSYSITVTWYQYWLLNHEYDKATGNYIVGETGKDSSLTKLTLSISTGFWFDRITPVFNMSYNENGSTTIMGMLMFMPGMHWMWTVTYQQMNELGASRYQDQVMFIARYEFW